MTDTPNQPPEPPDDRERLDRIRLFRTENVGPTTFFYLIDRFGSATEAIAALPELAARGGRDTPLRVAAPLEAEREIEAVAGLGGTHIIWGDRAYPALLAAIADPPPVLTVRGRTELLGLPSVAIVGARNASTNGRTLATRFGAQLGRAGFVVVSGLARGIDAAAHAGALATGTCAVMAGGVDVIYPPQNEALYHAILSKGVLVSEVAPGREPRAGHFPRRNRIVSGLTQGTVVVEAALRSGSLITARLAAEQGREVMAVPGSPLDARAHGSNDLIRNGATLVENAADVAMALSGIGTARMTENDTPAEAFPDAPEEPEGGREAVIRALGPSPVAVDAVIRDVGVPAATVQSVILELELAGRIERHAGGRIALLSEAA